MSERPSTKHLSPRHPLRLFLTAVQFYTRIPVPRWVGHSPAQLAAATPWFVVVGLCIGIASGCLFEATQSGFGPQIAALLALAAGMLITGAFHEDGFADVCDGFGGGYTPERVLSIMKDSRVGAFGAIGIGLLLLLQMLALARVAEGLAVLIAAHGLSRAAALLVAATLPYVREDAESKAKPVVENLAPSAVGSALLLGLLALLLAGHCSGAKQALVGLLLASVTTLWFRWRCAVRLGGYTGDCLGAVQQMAFTALLLGFAWQG